MVHLNAVLDAETAAPVVTAIRGFVTAAFAARQEAPDAEAPDADRRTVPMIQADALAVFCAHVLGCQTRVPVAGATGDRPDDEPLGPGIGAGIGGHRRSRPAGQCRGGERMAAGGGIIPCVLGADSEVLDWGAGRNALFTRAQRLALVERDGGCAMCGLPPEMTKAHHIRWWETRSRTHRPRQRGVAV